MKLTLAQVKASGLPAVVNMPDCDPRFLSLVNEAQQRLVMRPSTWYDLHYKYRISVTSGILTWPAEIASISSIAMCCWPITIRDMWFEFLDTGYGVRGCGEDEDACGCVSESLDRGVSPLAVDMSGSFKLKLYADLETDAGDIITIKGHDANGNWVRTVVGGSYIDGEQIAAAVLGTLSVNTFSDVTEVIKPQGDGPMRLYEWDATDSSQSLIGTYQWWETVPRYRRSFVGGICSTTEAQLLNVLAKREFIPARVDSDVLLIGNLPAIKAMALAIIKEDKNDLLSAAHDEARAMRILDLEAQHYLGHGMKVPIRMEAETWGAGGI